jgi:hypothetical protein
MKQFAVALGMRQFLAWTRVCRLAFLACLSAELYFGYPCLVEQRGSVTADLVLSTFHLKMYRCCIKEDPSCYIQS